MKRRREGERKANMANANNEFTVKRIQYNFNFQFFTKLKSSLKQY